MLILYVSMFNSESDRQNFADFYQRVKLRCFHVAIGITKDKGLAEDALHNGFEKLLSIKESFFALPCNKQESLIVVIVKNKAIDLMRKEKKTTVGLDEAAEEVIADDSDIVMDYENNESFERLVGYIKALPEIYQIVFELKYLHGFSISEIAGLLDLSKNTVTVRLNRARNKLIEMIRGDI